MSAMLNGNLPDTEYLEITSRSGNRYGAWITTPPHYDESADPLPLLYVLDGNWAVGLTAPLIASQADPFLPIDPFIQVTIGYAGEEAASWEHLRNRDLVPPGEPIGASTRATLEWARESGSMTQEQVDAYLEQLSNTRADAFLDFLTGELHPHVQSRLPVRDTGHGLFGYSYGGLFGLYAWLRREELFSTIGAGSPGVASSDSSIFPLLDALPHHAGDSPATRLHITLNEAELLGPIPFYREMSRSVLDVVDGIHSKGWTSALTTRIFRDTHVTGSQASFMSYLRTCRTGSTWG